jgi:hypothetical protein
MIRIFYSMGDIQYYKKAVKYMWPQKNIKNMTSATVDAFFRIRPATSDYSYMVARPKTTLLITLTKC